MARPPFRSPNRFSRGFEVLAKEHPTEADIAFKEGSHYLSADIWFWARAQSWSLSEATILSAGADPPLSFYYMRLDQPAEGLRESQRNFHEMYRTRLLLAQRAVDAKKLEDPVDPAAYIEWSAFMGMPFWEPLAQAVAELGPAQKSNQKISSEGSDKKARASLHKIILALAIKHYHYDHEQSKSPATANIADALDMVGLSLDHDTIRRHLKDAGDGFWNENMRKRKI